MENGKFLYVYTIYFYASYTGVIVIIVIIIYSLFEFIKNTLLLSPFSNINENKYE